MTQTLHAHTRIRIRIAALALALAVALATPAAAQDAADPLGEPGTDWVAMGIDAVLLRPAGVLHLVAGSIMFLPAAAMAAPGGRDEVLTARDIFVEQPYQNTFERKLGRF